ncbi:protein of unknown function [Rhodococcus tukisamuensis]|uniref:DUF4303 domain-containing protein n=1 Tax=Rhodococcus tukisamuensis TaxID=168276 RepID=A0A1G6SWR3_9NOCA|nr:protein of unknown function [Rhodococcus tukisamuensis]
MEAAVRDQIVAFVRRMRVEHPGDRIYGAAVHEFYAEAGGMIAWPMIGVVSEESLASAATDRHDADALRWSPADWPWQLDPGDAEDRLAERIEAAATADDGERWHAVHHRFERTVAKACKAARRTLIDEKIVGREFVAVAMDEAWELIPLSLTRTQVRRHFPELDEEKRALDRLAALPPAQRVIELIAIADSPVHAPPGTERARAWLRELGTDAVSAILEHLPVAREKWLWAKLLGELGIPTTEVVAALDAIVGNRRLGEPDRAWAAAALSRLGRMDLVTARLDRLPREVAVRGLTAPYTSFRDVGVHQPLDYGPLEAALTEHPALHDAVCDRLAPGSGYCTIDTDEVEAAFAGLASPWAAIRRHAVFVLSDTPLTPNQREGYHAELHRLATDPNTLVRDAIAVVGELGTPTTEAVSPGADGAGGAGCR